MPVSRYPGIMAAALLVGGSATADDAFQTATAPAGPPSRRVVIPGVEPGQELPPLLSVPGGLETRPAAKPCRSCAGDYNPNHVYLPDRSPDCGSGRNGGGGPVAWVNAAYLIGCTEDLGDIKRHLTHGFKVGAGLWDDADRHFGLDFGFLNTHDTYHQIRGGGLLVNSPVTFSTAEANGRINLGVFDRIRLDGLVGYRYLTLREKIFEGTAAGATEWRTAIDVHAGQVGLLADWKFGPYGAEVLGKLGLGSNRQSTTIDGVRTTESEFAVIPEAGAKVTYSLGENFRTTFGYTFLYLNHAARPDHRDPPDFYLHALNVGLEARY